MNSIATVIKKHGLSAQAMAFKGIILSEKSQSQQGTNHMTPFTYFLKDKGRRGQWLLELGMA